MADRFLREVKRMHQLRQDINEMTPEETDKLIRGIPPPPPIDLIELFATIHSLPTISPTFRDPHAPPIGHGVASIRSKNGGAFAPALSVSARLRSAGRGRDRQWSRPKMRRARLRLLSPAPLDFRLTARRAAASVEAW